MTCVRNFWWLFFKCSQIWNKVTIWPKIETKTKTKLTKFRNIWKYSEFGVKIWGQIHLKSPKVSGTGGTSHLNPNRSSWPGSGPQNKPDSKYEKKGLDQALIHIPPGRSATLFKVREKVNFLMAPHFYDKLFINIVWTQGGF